MSIILFLLVLFILVLVHEWGHFIVAKKTGMKVDEFGIGFPPKLFGIKRGETEYSFNALPIGGFVRIWGENYEDALVENETKDNGRGFSQKPKWAQALVLVAGVTMNVIFAWLLFSITYMVGIPTQVADDSISPSARLVIVETMPDSPGSVIPVGAEITKISHSDREVESPSATEFISEIQAVEGGEISVTYLQSGEKNVVSLNPVQGLSSNEGDYLLGVFPVMVDSVSKPFFTAIADGFVATWEGLKAICNGLYGLIAGSFTGEADLSQIAGPVGIVGMVGDAASFGLVSLLTFTAIISLNLAVINLLPFPALDGGRLLFVAIEAVTKKTIPPGWAGRLNLLGFALLMIIMIAVTYNDILRLL